MLTALRLEDFTGGINDVDPLMKLDPNECTWTGTTDVELFGAKGVLGPRRAWGSFVTTGAAIPTSVAGATRISNMRTWRHPTLGTEKVIYSNNAGLIQTMDVTSAVNPVVTVLASAGSAEYEFIQAQDSAAVEHVWCLNGISTPQKFNVSTAVLSAWGGTPPSGRFHRVWRNMMIISGVTAQPQRLYFSAVANPESWPANNFIDIKSTDDEADTITALEVIGENLLVFKEHSVWLVFDPVSFENRRIGDVGCVGRGAVCRSVQTKDELVYWVSRGGVYSTDGDEINLESKKIDNRFNDGSISFGSNLYISKQFTHLVMLADGKMFLHNWTAIGINSQNTVLYCDTKRTRSDGQHPWFRHTGAMAGITAMTGLFYSRHNSGLIANGAVAFLDVNAPGGGPHTPVDLLMDGDTTDDGADVGATYETGWLEITPSTEKKERIRRVNVHGETGSVDISLQPDEGGVVTSGTLSLSGLTRFARYRPEVRARFFQLKLTMGLGARISQVEMMYRGGTEH